MSTKCGFEYFADNSGCFNFLKILLNSDCHQEAKYTVITIDRKLYPLGQMCSMKRHKSIECKTAFLWQLTTTEYTVETAEIRKEVAATIKRPSVLLF